MCRAWCATTTHDSIYSLAKWCHGAKKSYCGGNGEEHVEGKGLRGILWAEAVATVIYEFNRSPTKGVTRMTLHEAWHGRKSVVHHLRMFIGVAFVKNTTPNLKKLDDRSHPMIFIGYEQGTKGYHVYDPSTRQVHVSRDVVFDEQAKWQWREDEGSDNSADDIFTVEYNLTWEPMVV
jgi:hypothetical protein